MSLNLPSLSFLSFSRCLRMDTAFLMRWYKSSGMEGASPTKWLECARIICYTIGLQDTKDLVSSYILYTSNAVGVTENDTNLRRGKTLSGELAGVLNDLRWGDLQPRGGSALVGQARAGDTLSMSTLKTTLPTTKRHTHYCAYDPWLRLMLVC